MDWLNNFFIPLIEIIFIVGIVGFIVFVVIRAVTIKWKQSWKWFLKYKILRHKYDESTVTWCVEAINKDFDYYGAKKLLLLFMTPDNIIKETLWIFKETEKNLKGGLNGRKVSRSNSSTKIKEFPKFSS